MIPPVQFPPKPVADSLVAPLRFYFSPKFLGLDEADVRKPALYVSNHTIFGLTDGVFLGVELYLQKDIQLRALVDELHLEVPFWRDLVGNLGMVKADRELCAQLMDQGAHILVFPGGRREIFKKKGEAYKLRWENRYGFIRMALAHGYDIIPVACLGGEETYDIVVDANEIMSGPVGWALKVTGISGKYLKNGDHLPPIAKGLGWTGLPKPERLYLKLGHRISTAVYSEHAEDVAVQERLKAEVEDAFRVLFEELEAVRAKDSEEEPWRKMLKRW